MNLLLSFPSFVIFAHFFFRVSCDVELKNLIKAIEDDNIQIMEKFLNGENRERVLGEAMIKVGNIRCRRFMEVMAPPGKDSPLRVIGNGALHWAVMKRAPKITRLLLENGADVNMSNFQGQTPLSLLAATSHCTSSDALGEKIVNEEILDTLFQFNPDVHKRSNLGLSPLLHAVEHGNVLLVAKLLEHGGDINESCGLFGMGKTLLSRALDKGYVEMAKFLLDNGAEADVRDGRGKNVLHIIFNTRSLMWATLSAIGKKNQAAMAKLLLRSENAENMLKQRENRYLKTPVDIFFEQSDPNRKILVDLLKILSSFDETYAFDALHIFSPSLGHQSSTWPMDNFPEYVKIAFNSYLEILSDKNSRRTFRLNALAKFFPKYEIKYFMKEGLYSLYVILRAHFQIRRGRSREEATEEVKKFDQYLRQLSVPFQNALWNAVVRDTTLEFLPTDILTKIFQHSQYNPYIQRMTKIMSLVQFTRTQRWSVEDMADAAPALMNYVEKKDILLL